MKPIGSFMRLVLAGSKGIARAPVPLGRIDLGEDEQDLSLHLEHYRAAPEDLSVEQSQSWGALCLYCLARCSERGRACPLLSASFSTSQIRVIQRGVDFWRLKEVAGAKEAGAFVEQLRVEEAPPEPPEEAESHGTEPEQDGHLPPTEIEWLRPKGETCRFRIRRSQYVESDPETPLIARFLVADPLGVTVALVGTAPSVMSQGEVGLFLDDEWQEVGLCFSGLGSRRVRRIELVDLRGGPGQALNVPPGSHPIEVAPQSSVPLVVEPESEPPWLHAIEGQENRALLLQLAKHGAVTEEEAMRILGSHRALRRFSAGFEGIIAQVPFRVRIEMTDSGKRYVREGDR